MDWRSFSQVKELGVAVKNCPCVALDVKKIWEVYFYTGLRNSTLPANGKFNQSDDTNYNAQNRFSITFDNHCLFCSPSLSLSLSLSQTPPLAEPSQAKKKKIAKRFQQI